MNLFKKEAPKPKWTKCYKIDPLGEGIPVYIDNGIQITHIIADNRAVEVRLSVPKKDGPEIPQEPMRRFRVYDHDLQEMLKQQDDYSFRTDTGYYVCDLIDALEDTKRFTVQENTEIKDIRHNYIFKGDKVGFTEDVFGLAVSRKGTVVRSDTGMWQVMVDETIPFGLYHVKDRIILGHINEGV